MKNLLLSSILALVLAAPSLGASKTGPSRTDNAALGQPAAGRPIATSDWVWVTSAQRLIGRRVHSRDAREAGRINEFVVDQRHGIVIYALIGSGGDLKIGRDRIVVPFAALRIPTGKQGSPVALNQDLGRMRINPRVTDDEEIDDLGNAKRLREIHADYGIPPPPAYALAPDRGRQRARYILVRPDGLIRLERPGPLTRDLRGRKVWRSGGGEVGEIDRIMIDVTTGRIPYLLLSSGGFLGLGEEWLPVPPTALAWSPLGQVYVLKGENVRPEAMRTLNKTDLPARIHREQLDVLYQRFNIPPYWDGRAALVDG